MNISPVNNYQFKNVNQKPSFKMFKADSLNVSFIEQVMGSLPKEIKKNLKFRPLMDIVKERFGEKSLTTNILTRFIQPMQKGSIDVYVPIQEEKLMPEKAEAFINYIANRRTKSISTHELSSQIFSVRGKDEADKQKGIAIIEKMFMGEESKKPTKWYSMKVACGQGLKLAPGVESPCLGDFMSDSQISVLEIEPNFAESLISAKTAFAAKEKHPENMFEYLSRFIKRDGLSYFISD